VNILHVVPTLDPAAGGPPRIALSLAAGAASLGHHVTMLYYDSPHARLQIDQQLDEIAGARLVHLHILPPATRFEKLTARKSRSEIARTLKKIDIVHVHSIWNPISLAAMSKAGKRKIPYIVLVNGMLDPWSLSQSDLKKKIAMKFGVRKLLNDAAFLQAGNTEEKECIAQVGLTSPIKIIPNGVDPKQFEQLPARGSFYTAHPELNNQPYILFLSRLHFKKGLDYLAAAFAILSKSHFDLHLVVAGPDDGARASFEADIRNRQLQDRVHVIGPIFAQEKLSAFQDALCFCLPSRQEGFSVAVLEAMACATPVVISAACHFPELAEQGAGEVVQLDAPEIAAAIDGILIDPPKRQRMGGIAREMIFEHFTWPKISEQLIQAYGRSLPTNADNSPQRPRRTQR
jgi:glycosyltransferase involved in cell wall biosynthesis